MSWIAVGIGAVLGAWMRWGLSVFLNNAHSQLPVGTLVANLVGGFLIGIAVAFFNQSSAVSMEWRLFIVTGFLGSLTTFSAFSAESLILLQRGELFWALGHTLLHLAGSLAFCAIGFVCYRLLSVS